MSTTDYFLSKGAHTRALDGRCAMEWVAYLAGEEHSDKPGCVSPVLTRFCIALNDRLLDAERQKLRPYLARTIGTRGDGRDPERLELCRTWIRRTSLPRVLDAAGLTSRAERIRSLPGSLAGSDRGAEFSTSPGAPSTASTARRSRASSCTGSASSSARAAEWARRASSSGPTRRGTRGAAATRSAQAARTATCSLTSGATGATRASS